MPVPTGKIRGLQDIRTHAGRAEDIRLPHQALLRVAWLEMEKYRRVTEKRTAVHRVQSIDERVREIELEQHRLMSTVRVPRPPSNSDCEDRCDSRQSGFKIRY